MNDQSFLTHSNMQGEGELKSMEKDGRKQEF